MLTRDEFLFDCEMSTKYHRRRASFLEQAGLALTFVTLLGGTGAFLSLSGEGTAIAKICALVVTIASLVRVVYKPDACAGLHKGWLSRWRDLLTEARTTSQPDHATLTRWAKEQSAIERECVGEMRALQADCFNRAARSLGLRDDEYRLRWWHRALLHVAPFEHAFERRTA